MYLFNMRHLFYIIMEFEQSLVFTLTFYTTNIFHFSALVCKVSVNISGSFPFDGPSKKTDLKDFLSVRSGKTIFLVPVLTD